MYVYKYVVICNLHFEHVTTVRYNIQNIQKF